jgi:hypothetical protein
VEENEVINARYVDVYWLNVVSGETICVFSLEIAPRSAGTVWQSSICGED